MIDALFGSRTRVKLLHLFLNNPDKSYYVREITRIIDEQINSVRRELANMLKIGIINSENSDNKLYYAVNQQYEYYIPLKAIFGDDKTLMIKKFSEKIESWRYLLDDVEKTIRLVIASGVLVENSDSNIDLLFIGNAPTNKIQKIVKSIEKVEGRELNYTFLPHEEFYYRLSVRDKFITDILHNKFRVLIDIDQIFQDKAKIEEQND